MNQKLRIALPKGSLNDGKRGNIEQILKFAGYKIEGYEPRNERLNPQILNEPDIEVFTDRPQDMAVQLFAGTIDAAVFWK